MTDTPTPGRGLPEPVAALIGIAALLLWIGFLLLVVGLFFYGRGAATLLDFFPRGVEEPLRSALYLQTGLTVLGVVAIWSLSTWVAGTHIMGRRAEALGNAIWMIRILMGLAVMRLGASLAIPLATGGLAAAVPGLATGLPLVLIELAFLGCAHGYLTDRSAR